MFLVNEQILIFPQPSIGEKWERQRRKRINGHIDILIREGKKEG